MTHPAAYVELHAHSYYSFLDGTASPVDLVLGARELGYPALALTDHNGLYGAMEFTKAAHGFGLRPILGAEVTMKGGYHLVLLAETAQGYAHLCRLLSHAHLSQPKNSPKLDLTTLRQHVGGLIALSGCARGEVPTLLDQGRYREAAEAAQRFREIFGAGRFFLELQQNYVYGDTERCERLVSLAEHLGLGYVATNNVHYLEPTRHRLHDALTAIRHRLTLDTSHRERRANDQFHLQAPQAMAKRFARYPRVISISVDIAERCTFDLTQLDYKFPDFVTPDGSSADAFLEFVCRTAALEKYGRITSDLEARLQQELALIRLHELADFFLINWEIIQHTHRNKFSARERGSSVSSLVCYLLGLSAVDPLQYDLSIGRFLNAELRSIPGIDLDFSRDARAKMMQHVYEKYGRDYAGLVCAFPSYRLRSAVRELGKVLGLPEAQIDKLARVAEDTSATSLRDQMVRLTDFQDKVDAPLWKDLMTLAEEIAGVTRHVSQHVGGMIISSRPLVELVPLEPARMEGRVLIQWDKDSVDDARFVKMDFLALGMLSLVDEAVDLIEYRHEHPVRWHEVRLDDPAVYDMISREDTIGVFQIESRAQQQTLPRIKPRAIHDLVVQVAIIRPGPIVGGGTQAYLPRRQGLAPVTYDDPSLRPLLDPILGETLGIILFQDQVQQVAMAVAGFSEGRADAFRRAMSRKRSREAMLALWAEFRDGALQKGIPKPAITRTFRKLMAFASYRFPKAHAAAFGVLAYQSAWLKLYYPTEFLTALLNNQLMGFYSPNVLLGDTRRHGVTVLHPDINRSRALSTIEGGAVRLGLGFAQGVSKASAERMVELREQGGVYRSLWDVVRRSGLRREGIENLIQVGALDGFGLGRRELLWQLGLVWRPSSPQAALPLPIEQDMVALPAMTAWERMIADYAVLGMSPQSHPMQFLRGGLPTGTLSSREVAGARNGARVVTAGLVAVRQRPHTAK